MNNLKEVFMILGNKLVTEQGYEPGYSTNPRSTKPIVDFTNFLNNSAEAREILAELGFEWPVVKYVGQKNH